MKTNRPSFQSLSITILSCLVAGFCAAGELTAQKSDTAEELKKFEVDWAVAVESNDVKRIEAFFTLDFLFVGPKGLLQDRLQHLEDFRSGKLHVDSVKIESQTIHIYKGAAVISSRVMVKGKIKVNGERDFSVGADGQAAWGIGRSGKGGLLFGACFAIRHNNGGRRSWAG